jgi:pimeloyl-ACP methyl ester carboxylesterase
MIRIGGNLEKEELNEQARGELDGMFIELSEGFTHYELIGEEGEETVVLIHGNAAPYVTWDNTIGALIDTGFKVLRYDLFGHGFSDKPNLDKYTRGLYDDQLVELLAKLAVSEPIHIVGTSQGGSIGVYFAAKHPEKVRKLALLSPFFDRFEESSSANLLKVRFIGEFIIQLVGDNRILDLSKAIASVETRSALTREIEKQLRYKGKKRAILANLRGDALSDATPYYEEVKEQGIPMLLTWGSKDQSISRESMNRLRVLIPEIEYHEIENAAHLAHYEFPERINPILVRFLME